MRFAGFIGPSYTSQSVNVDAQRCVNMYPEINALGTGKEREVASLVPTPGLKLLQTLPKSVMRGMWTASNGTLFVVLSDKFYEISSSWAFTERGTLNTEAGAVSIADNGNDVFIVDGAFGYTWKISTSVFAVVSDPDFYPADQVAFQDGYFIFIRKGTQQFFISGINDVTFDGLDIASAEGAPDNLVGLISNSQNIMLFGAISTEVFYNSGDPDFPFARSGGAVLDFGCSAPFSIAKIVGSIFWLGGDSNGTGIVYKMQGMQAQRVSTPAIESVIRNLTSAQIALARGYTYQQGGHIFYCLNIPGLESTLVFDGSTDFWHERTYTNLWSLERHRAECHQIAYGISVVGDYQNGKLYQLDQDTYSDDGISIARIRTAPHITAGLTLIRHNSFQLDMEVGVGTDGVNQGNNPQAMIRYSDDGGHSWSNERWQDIGKIGKRLTRVIWRRLGMSRDRIYEIRITDPVKVVLIGAEINTEQGVA